MIYLYWTAVARDADEGRTVFSRPGGGTRVGERLRRAAADAVQRPGRAGPGVRPVRGRARRPGASQSVFDNGLPLGRDRLDRATASSRR